eukprot:m.242020 g.242020  ORF g.242020 m.242020 type:complete len:69 (+) comp15330_c0_seq15:275-481(+)
MQWVFVCSVDVGQDYIPLGQPAAFLYTTTAICSKARTTLVMTATITTFTSEMHSKMNTAELTTRLKLK